MMYDEETLDPATDAEWEEMRALGHRLVDEVVALHRGIGGGPAWRPVPLEARRALSGPIPASGAPLDETLDRFREHVLPYHLGNIHPRGWGWVNGTGSTLGAYAELLAAAMNVNCAGAQTGALFVEAQVMDTLKARMGWPAGGSGILVSGASVANLVGLAAARDRAGMLAPAGCAPVDVGREGVGGLGLSLYASEAVHNSVDRAVRLLGIGTDRLRKIPVDDDWRMDVTALERAIVADRAAGMRPFCVVATAGTVDHGAVDPLEAIADTCAREGLWLHVDGAFGAVAALSEELRPLVAGMERADSLAFDLHKWMHVPIEAACVLVRDPADHRRPFASSASYLNVLPRGVAATDRWMYEYGPQLTRGFRALKAWFILGHHGAEKIGRLAAQNVRQTRRLEALLRAEPGVEVLASGPLCVLCFRWRPRGLAAEALDRLNEQLLADLQESGRAVVSSTVVRGAFALRLALTNHRTRHEDLVELVAAVRELGLRLAPGV
jgi:glutamate/tyrosine decarboxylase-like PLP-dependent enzyme